MNDEFIPILPEAFVRRMQALLGPEAESFFDALHRPRDRGLRVNTFRITPEAFATRSPFSLQSLPWIQEGFAYRRPDRPGLHPWHDAGVYYLQDPSAMAAAILLDPQPGELVLDLAAAPGGKTTHLAARMDNRGLVVANEPHPQRVRVLGQNIERLGIRNTLVIQEKPENLVRRWPGQFDRVLVDAPCSGESMFRKDPVARSAWREEAVARNARVQRKILAAAAELVRPGGRLLYATCTFSPEENEQVIAWFLETRPDFRLVPAPLPGSSPGRPEWGGRDDLVHCLRFWPHKSPSDGHFYALMERAGPAESFRPRPKSGRSSRHVRDDFRPIRLPGPVAEIFREYLPGVPLPEWWEKRGDLWIALPDDFRLLGDLSGIRSVSKGVAWGSVQGRHFTPAHGLAMTLRAAEVPNRLSWPAGAQEIDDWLRGKPLPAPSSAEPGWVWIGVDEFPLGWGKISEGQVKNHYPKGLRRPVE